MKLIEKGLELTKKTISMGLDRAAQRIMHG